MPGQTTTRGRRPAPPARPKQIAIEAPPEVHEDLDILCAIEAERTGGNPERLRGPVIRGLIRAARRASGR